MEDVALVLGEALVDVVTADGATASHPGGSIANVAVALARLGRPVWIGTAYADDDDGRLLATHLRRAGVGLAADPRVVARTSRAVATIGPDRAATYEFELDWRLGDLELPDDARPVVVHTGSIGAVLPPGAERVRAEVERARTTATVSYDLNVRPSITGTGEDVLERVGRLVALADVVKASDEDLETLWPGRPVEDSARAVLAGGASLVAVTGGGEGARWWTRSASGRVAPVRVEVVDTIGAGDTFMAGLLDALWRAGLLGADRRDALAAADDATVDEVCAWAARAAAVTVSRPGADPPTLAELGP